MRLTAEIEASFAKIGSSVVVYKDGRRYAGFSSWGQLKNFLHANGLTLDAVRIETEATHAR